MKIQKPELAPRQLSLAVTGHRRNNAQLKANLPAVEKALISLFEQIDARLDAARDDLGPVILHNLMADGIDQITSEAALARGWELAIPLPFGRALNAAINLHPASPDEAKALLNGEAVRDQDLAGRSAHLDQLLAQARVFELADRDEDIAELYLSMLQHPDDVERRSAFETQSNDQVALAGRVMIERADLLLAVWDGKISNLRGGTGHTVRTALNMGTPVLLIDPSQPEVWSILSRPEDMFGGRLHDLEQLHGIIDTAVGLTSPDMVSKIDREQWHLRSSRLWALYRGIERAFGSDARDGTRLVTKYERPDEIAEGSAAGLVQAAKRLPNVDQRQLSGILGGVIPQFAWADGISSWLSDAYRSGMCLNFILAAFAVIIGAAYLPLGLADHKWLFASAELLLLLMIVFITIIGKRHKWHARWFETRRVAEYLRHGPIMSLLGISRPAGRWPRSEGSAWPEHYSKHSLRAVGLPHLALDRDYLRTALSGLLQPHVEQQRSYHSAKASRLLNVNRRLDKIAEGLFILAILSVSLYLALKAGAALGLLPYAWPTAISMTLTFCGIAFPTLGASIAGIRFFADFERFAAISQATAGKLEQVDERIGLLLGGADHAISFATVSELAHAVDQIVIEELENWQAVFSGKHISLPA
ncbi:hypothetical protein OZN62_08650 [Aurantiacibacter sp. MUD11]|uniref:hypothetical protein n=1 Tax=Aurantiacibacter sp. MUD11 TaxID=3003265 RepID=UPI0022AA0E94|nr:hypothetical protein [Aurantiacibacter sp. MUD11]WAT17010.1 hypothetical protein OZN62_08650 [Aurantiacibacter sp. MUD11]